MNDGEERELGKVKKYNKNNKMIVKSPELERKQTGRGKRAKEEKIYS